VDMAELTVRAALPVRKLRYVLDHAVLPGHRGVAGGHGVPRTFTPYEGFGIALAARLLDAGLSRRLIVAVLAVACRPTGSTRARGRAIAPADVPLFRAYSARAGTLEIGDGRFLRLRAPRCPGVGDALDTGWLAVDSSGRPAVDYTPGVHVTAELGGLAGAVQERRGESARSSTW
jgi:hypothetical protein